MATRRSRWSRHAPLVALAVGAVVAIVAHATPAARTDSRPNVVVVLVDDMGWSDIGPYGGEIPTPNLDALARRGVRFTQFYATPRCSPTRASLLTGVYPHQAGMGHLDNVVRAGSSGTTGRLNDRSVTIAEALRAAGYFTAMSGKWHLGQDNGSPPWQRGFDRVLSLRAGGMYFPNQNFSGGGDALTARAHEPLYLDGTATPRDAPVFGDHWYATDLWTDFGLRFVDDARKAGKPFFLYLAYNAPHFPLMAPADLIARHRGKYKAGWDRLREARYRRQVTMGLIDRRWPMSPRDPASADWESLTDDAKERFDHLMAVYAAMIEAIDTNMGRLVKGLEARGALDDTLILFMSDNGANAETGPAGRFDGDPPGGPNSNLYLGMNWATLSAAPFRRFKHFTNEGGIAVPLIAHWPRGIPAGRRNALVHEPAHVVDVMPTILEVTGATYPREFRGQAIQATEGVSLLPVLAGRALARTQPLFWEHEGNRAVRSGKWKLVSTFPKQWELYDMTADRVERNDLAATRPDLVKALAAAWQAWAARTNVDPWTGPPRLPWGDDAPARAGEAGSDSRLPDGTEFPFWEKPLSFTRTYYVDGGSPRSDDRGPGTRERPFRTIGKAAAALQPGERVVIAAGTYRECIRPARGGSAPDKMISYEAAPGAAVIVKASEVLRDGWQPDTEPMPGDDGAVRIWKHELSGALFPDAYNPFAIANVPGDWSWLDTKRVDMGPYFRRRGMIFVDGRPLEPVEQYRELGNVPLPGTPQGQEPPRGGLPGRTRGGPILQEVGGSADARFWVEHQGNVVHIRVPSGDPARSVVEITAREQAFAPRESGLGYIRIKGLIFRHAGNAFPPPQRGLVSTAGGHHWIIEGNTIEWSSGVGLDIGEQHWRSARDPVAGDSHIVRANTIRYAGVEGIGGMGTTNTLVEDNLIEWVGWQDAERAWEAAGAKFHRARNLLFRRNVVRHMRHANALWLDSGNSNSRITQNVFADVLTVSAAIHMEMNRATNQIDNNVIWDVRNAEPGTPGQRGAGGSGIFLHASARQIVAQNLIGRCENVGVFPVLRPERANAGNGREHKVHNNVFARCDKGGIVFVHEDNEADGNIYASLPERFGALGEGDAAQWFDLPDWRAHGWDRRGAAAELELAFDPDRLELTLAGPTAWPAMPVFNGIDTDLAGHGTGGQRPPGPFADPGAARARSVDPRATPAR